MRPLRETEGMRDGLDATTDWPLLNEALNTDPGTGVIQHVDAGYPEAIEFAQKSGIKIPMLKK